ncbi:MAG TPA: Ku protein [Longimicrobiaceae bacterium]|nr:Ku protein [Longimicrobiaceae bacterium]
MPEDDEVGARPFWSGTITFGLVSVPVNLLPANRSDKTSLRMVSPEGKPLSRRYFTTRDDKELKWEDIVRGYEFEKDQYVVVDDDELERLAPDRTRDIDLRVFVKTSEIDPMHFERAYYLTPAGTSTKAYRLLAHAMEETDRAGIASFVMRAKEYLIAILAENGILRAETLRFADEIRTPEMVGLPEPVTPKAADVKRMEKEIPKLAEDELDPDELVERSSEKLLKLVKKKKRTGDDVVSAPPEAKDSDKIIDLVEMLQRSLKAGPPAKQKTSKGSGDDLAASSKAELYEKAKKLDIPGRSEMSKDELVTAIRAAS